MTINDVLTQHSTSLDVMADLVADKLIHDDQFALYRDNPVTESYKAAVKEDTLPLEGNYSTFSLTNDSITFYKTYRVFRKQPV